MSNRSYYTLLQLEHGRWVPEFGDYDRSNVLFERDEYRDKGVSALKLKIIQTGDLQRDINEAVARLNGDAR